MLKRLPQERADAVLMRLLDGGHVHRRVSLKAGEDLAGLLGVHEGLGRLGLEEVHDGNPIRAAHHERVVRVPNDAGQLTLDDAVENVVCLLEIKGFHDSSKWTVDVTRALSFGGLVSQHKIPAVTASDGARQAEALKC